MANIYVGTMKDYLKAYYKKIKELNVKIAENNERFTPEYAKPENEKILEQKAKAYNEAKANITGVFTDIREALASASFLNVESLTADRLFFDNNSGFALTADEVRGYVERYKDNYTMLRLIKDWIAKQDTSAYASISITMPSDILNAYKKFADGALSVVEKIHEEGLIMNDPIELDAFADENWAHSLFDVVGSGMQLNDYKNRRIPDTAKHIFDDVTITSDPNYYMAS